MSNNHGLTAESFLNSLPYVLQRDTGVDALATGIAQALEERAAEIQSILLYPVIDQLPEELLDILAHDFKVDWYNYDYPLEAKRNTIKTHWYVHRHLGTIGAVRVAIQAIYPRSSVEEWWQDGYDGEPYHFRIALEAGYPIIPVANTDILDAVKIYKSLRSWLDDIIYRTTVIVGICITCGWVAYSGRVTGIYPQRARQGQIYDSNIEIETHAAAEVYTDPASGVVTTGTFPQIARLGEIVTDRVAIVPAGQSLVYQNPVTGEIDAGVFPDTAVQGMVESGMIGASASGEGLAYSTRRCGSTPGSPI